VDIPSDGLPESPNLCVVCMEEKVSILILPCAHLCVCPECAGSVGQCPLCRKPFKGYVRVFLTH
jgi:Zinc finger, C3HC4 type (RING finger)